MSNCKVDELRKMFPDEAFQEAIASIETIAMKTEDKQMYDTREKLARDHQWLMSAGLKRAHDEGLAEGIEQGREEGREEGLEIGREVGEWIGTIRTCQAILESPASTDDDLKNTTPDQLKSLAIELQTKVRTRMGKS